MPVRVRFFAYFREVFEAKELEVPAAEAPTLARLLERLASTPRRREELFAGAGLKPHLILMINGAPPPSSPGEAALRDGDVVSVFPLIGGG